MGILVFLLVQVLWDVWMGDTTPLRLTVLTACIIGIIIMVIINIFNWSRLKKVVRGQLGVK